MSSLNLVAQAGTDRPYTIVNFVATADGRAAFKGRSGSLGSDGSVAAAAPTQLLTFVAPQTNRATTLTFRQNITAAETLRAGTYGKTLTFTLSTTAP